MKALESLATVFPSPLSMIILAAVFFVFFFEEKDLQQIACRKGAGCAYGWKTEQVLFGDILLWRSLAAVVGGAVRFGFSGWHQATGDVGASKLLYQASPNLGVWSRSWVWTGSAFCKRPLPCYASTSPFCS